MVGLMKLVPAASLLLLSVAEAWRFVVPTVQELRESKISSSSHYSIDSIGRRGGRGGLKARDVNPQLLYPTRTLAVPVDHFHNETRYEPHTNDTFELNYWFDASHYVEGGPVIVLQGGETAGTDRLAFLQKGILAQLAQATNGIGVVLEHRFYGDSFPTKDLSIESLRFLTTEQALADMAYFAQNVVFPGLENKTLTAPTVPYIAYGGSYAGAFVAILRVQYPEIYWGAISSSGVTKAIYDYWEYYAPIIEFGPQDCITTIQRLVSIVDNIILVEKNATLTNQLKAAYQLEGLKSDADFGNIVSGGLGGWQSRNWDPAVNSNQVFSYCDMIASATPAFNATPELTATVKDLIAAGGWENETATLTTRMLNFIHYINETEASPCKQSGLSLDECFTASDPEFYSRDDLQETWRSWPYQYCTEWGFLQTGSGVPADQLGVISRLITLEYESIICEEAFNVTEPPDTDRVNKYGGFDIAYDRLAFIDGEQDPWRPATPHSPAAKNRTSTTNQPFILISGAVHHWDENGLFPNQTTADLPPGPVADAQKAEHDFVLAWLEEWKSTKAVELKARK